jgi:HD domain-containing protein
MTEAARAGPDPDGRWAPDMGRFAGRLAADLCGQGHPWPDLAAAVLTARGRRGRRRAEFADTVGIPIALLAVVEDGVPCPVAGGAVVARDSEDGMIGPRFVAAVGRACEWHAGQTRKSHPSGAGQGPAIPYISHLLAAASLVLEDGGSEDEAIAALLHDCVEDQGVTPETLDRLFGPEVARIVVACSDAAAGPGQAKAPWRERKLHHLAGLRRLPAGDPVFRVTAADKLHNCTDTVSDVRRYGPGRLADFNGGTAGTLWYYTEMSSLLEDRLPTSRLTAELTRQVETLNGLVSRPTRGEVPMADNLPDGTERPGDAAAGDVQP